MNRVEKKDSVISLWTTTGETYDLGRRGRILGAQSSHRLTAHRMASTEGNLG